jgi:hypothetical protein
MRDDLMFSYQNGYICGESISLHFMGSIFWLRSTIFGK